MTSLTRRALAGLPLAPMLANAAHAISPADKPLKILVLGGTRFVGPAIVEAALARGHDITLFNRGITQPWMFPGIVKLRGDRFPERSEGLDALKTGAWDVAIDLPAYYPRHVAATADLLKGRVGRYIMMSSISVYANYRTVGIDETFETRTLAAPVAEGPDLNEDAIPSYGALKVQCEQAVAERFPGASTVLRASGVAGGGLSDPTKWYWLARMKRDNVVLAPGAGGDAVQLVDRRDVADFAVRAAEQNLDGIYNLVGPRVTFRDVLETSKAIVGGDTRIVWMGEDRDNVVRGVPYYAPEYLVPGFAAISSEKARANGFTHRTLEDTLSEDWLWFRQNHAPGFDFAARNIGFTAEQEAAGLKKAGVQRG